MGQQVFELCGGEAKVNPWGRFFVLVLTATLRFEGRRFCRTRFVIDSQRLNWHLFRARQANKAAISTCGRYSRYNL
jgi:hypothetical protein